MALLVALTAPLFTPGSVAPASERAQGFFRVRPFAEVQVSDDTVSGFTATPTSADPGPRVWSNTDKMRFNSRYTNTKTVLLLEIANAQTSGGSSTVTVQGTLHTITDWIHIRTGASDYFAKVTATGVYDSDTGAYTAPGGFTTASQGTISLAYYDKTTPPDGGTGGTVYWIYDSGQNVYMFDTADKDFTNGNGEVTVAPVANKGESTYSLTFQGNDYSVASVGASGANYVPSMKIGWEAEPAGSAGGRNYDAYMLIDFPSGAPTDSYSFTVEGTIHKLK